ncbi:uncharacterized protein LOC111870813 isoform X2 [Cryptotermes secundus]|uniref:uncharacterized protein LOC111870813 isoform X2 n=1 Tax=Cryptotermes secundus TaxID=105785 RepID=UPI001454D026|nr:uncharacterized protein LOC111870813 isoform X2 [Cryptotermes secundus]
MTRQRSAFQILLLLSVHLSSVSCSSLSTPEFAVGMFCITCFGIATMMLICYKRCCSDSSTETAPQIPTVTIVEIPNRVTCPFCSGVSSDCPLSTNPAYLYAHPPPAYQPPPDYSSLVFQEIPKLQQTFPSPDSAPSFDHPKRYSLGCKYSTSF